jgi:hypothetical protein
VQQQLKDQPLVLEPQLVPCEQVQAEQQSHTHFHSNRLEQHNRYRSSLNHNRCHSNRNLLLRSMTSCMRTAKPKGHVSFCSKTNRKDRNHSSGHCHSNWPHNHCRSHKMDQRHSMMLHIHCRSHRLARSMNACCEVWPTSRRSSCNKTNHKDRNHRSDHCRSNWPHIRCCIHTTDQRRSKLQQRIRCRNRMLVRNMNACCGA